LDDVTQPKEKINALYVPHCTYCNPVSWYDGPLWDSGQRDIQVVGGRNKNFATRNVLKTLFVHIIL
jgi:hypothetical protein